MPRRRRSPSPGSDIPACNCRTPSSQRSAPGQSARTSVRIANRAKLFALRRFDSFGILRGGKWHLAYRKRFPAPSIRIALVSKYEFPHRQNARVILLAGAVLGQANSPNVGSHGKESMKVPVRTGVGRRFFLTFSLLDVPLLVEGFMTAKSLCSLPQRRRVTGA